MPLYKCTVNSDNLLVADKIEYFNSKNFEILKQAFKESFKIKDSPYYGYNSVTIQSMTLDAFPEIIQVRPTLPKNNRSLSEKKLYEIIIKIVNANPLLITRVKNRHAVDHLTRISMREVNGKVSPKEV